MLKKLLKYDFKFIFKYWWIVATVCLSLSAVGGFCLRTLISSISERELPAVVTSSANFVLVLTIMSFVAFALTAPILIFIRFYKNFFSDEGYLTFTLPVKLTTHINSKVILSTLTTVCTVIAIGICVFVMLCIGFWEDFWSKEFWQIVGDIIKTYFDSNILCRIIYIIEFLLLCVLAAAFSNLFLFFCITLACTVTKKARVITSIGIYYGVNWVISLIMQIFAIFGISAIAVYFENIAENLLEPVLCLTGLGILLLISILCVILYAVQHKLLDRKLNLA
jgi:hypothetical protein